MKRKFYENLNKKYPPWFDKNEPKRRPKEFEIDVPVSIKEMYRTAKLKTERPEILQNSSSYSDTINNESQFESLLHDENNKKLIDGLLNLIVNHSDSRCPTSHRMKECGTLKNCNLENNNDSVGNVDDSEIISAVQSLSDHSLARVNSSIAALFDIERKTIWLMDKPWLCIGSDGDICDVVLSTSLCKRVSQKHAVLFFDAKSRQFEVLNYR